MNERITLTYQSTVSSVQFMRKGNVVFFSLINTLLSSHLT